MEKDDILKQMIESYSKLSIQDKRKELGREIAETTFVIKKLLNDLLPDNIRLSDNFDDLNNLFFGNSSEGEYLTGLFEDYLNFKELLGIYLDKVTDMYYDKNDE